MANALKSPEIAHMHQPFPPKLDLKHLDAAFCCTDTDNDKNQGYMWPRFELLASIGNVDTEIFAGVTVAAPTDLYADLIAYKPQGSEWAFSDVLSALQVACIQVCFPYTILVYVANLIC